MEGAVNEGCLASSEGFVETFPKMPGLWVVRQLNVVFSVCKVLGKACSSRKLHTKQACVGYRGAPEGSAGWGGGGRTSVKIQKEHKDYPVNSKGQHRAKTQS